MTVTPEQLDDLATRLGQEFLIGFDDLRLIRQAAELIRKMEDQLDAAAERNMGEDR